jgi:hypothetical protein
VDELGVFEGFAGGCINDGAGSVECNTDVGNLCGEAGHVMLDDDVGLIVTAAGMMGWEVLASFSAVGVTCAGTSLRPGGAGDAGVDGYAVPEESGSFGGFCLCFCFTATALPWVDGGGNVCGDRGDSAGDRSGPGDALWGWSSCWGNWGRAAGIGACDVAIVGNGATLRIGAGASAASGSGAAGRALFLFGPNALGTKLPLELLLWGILEEEAE